MIVAGSLEQRRDKYAVPRFAIALLLALTIFFAIIPEGHAQTSAGRLVEDAARGQGKYTTVGDAWAGSWAGYAANSATSNKAAVLLAGIIVGIMTLAYLAGAAFQNDELKNFAKMEFLQAAATLVVVIMLYGGLLFLDQILEGAASPNGNEGIISPCGPGYTYSANTPRSLQYANCYIGNLYDMANLQARNKLKESIEHGRAAYRMLGYQSDTIWLLYTGMNIRPEAYRRLDMEIAGQEFDLFSKIMISLSVQKAFLNNVIPAFAPTTLLMGIILRGFFPTRKLGGLFMASGIALLVIYPAAYLLAWVTLQVAAFGPQIAGSGDVNPTCPMECKILPPAAYYNQKSAGEYKPDEMISTEDFQEVIGKINLDRKAQNPPQGALKLGDEKELLKLHIQTCFPSNIADKQAPSSIVPADASEACPLDCRFLPLPRDLQCDQAACDRIPNACKAIRAMGALNYTTYNKANDQYCNNECQRKDCPDICKKKLPEVKLGAAVPSTSGTPVSSVVPSEHGGACGYDKATKGNDDTCEDCPLYCKQYFTDLKYTQEEADKIKNGQAKGDYKRIFDASEDCNTKACIACQQKLDSTGTAQEKADCFEGVPLIMTADCNDDKLCGPALAYTDVAILDQNLNFDKLKNPDEKRCPVDCRVYFDASNEQYKDPAYKKYCENAEMIKSCSTCPASCKINASALGIENSGKKNAAEGSSIEVSCSIPPTFTGGKMSGTYAQPCSRCPVPCRFKEAIANPQPEYNAFRSTAQNAIVCIFDPNEKVTYKKNPKNIPTCLYNQPDNSGAPGCSPASEAYKSMNNQLPQFARCPQYGVNAERFVYSWENTAMEDGTPVIVAMVVPNQDTTTLCSSPDAIEFCKDNYCPSECKPSFEDSGPFYCDVKVDKYDSDIPDNFERCNKCYAYDGSYTTGPQCQVIIINDNKQYSPYGCSAECVPDKLKPKEVGQGICNGFCYPRLNTPLDAGSCQAYDFSAQRTAASDFGNCEACPIDCRYDFFDGKISENALKECGYDYDGDKSNGMNPIKDAHNCDTSCRGLIKSDAGRISACEAAYHSCSQNAETGDYWTRDGSQLNILGVPAQSGSSNYQALCSLNVVKHVTTGAYKTYKEGDLCRPSGQACQSGDLQYCENDGANKCIYSDDWDVQRCSAQYTFQSGYTPKICTISLQTSKYPELDRFIQNKNGDGSKPANDRYYECGELNPNGVNKNFNFCGSYMAGSTKISGCEDDCKAYYNARAIECLPYAGFTDDMSKASSGKTSKPAIGADTNCQECPRFCRVEGRAGSLAELCTESDMFYIGGYGPKCASPGNCDIRVADGGAPQPQGYCGMPYTDFKIGGSCGDYISGAGVGCPARCRITVPGGVPPIGCTGEEIGQACVELLDYPACLGSPSEPPCAGCIACEDDCKSTPYVRQDCSDLCTPEDMFAGKTKAGAGSLMSSYNGAAATNSTWQTIGSLSVAAIALPIFAIVITIAFARRLSPILGGDMEIPGLYKLIG